MCDGDAVGAIVGSVFNPMSAGENISRYKSIRAQRRAAEDAEDAERRKKRLIKRELAEEEQVKTQNLMRSRARRAFGNMPRNPNILTTPIGIVGDVSQGQKTAIGA